MRVVPWCLWSMPVAYLLPSRVVIVPGLGGSVLRDAVNNQTVWPPMPTMKEPRPLDVRWNPHHSRVESIENLQTLPMGELAGIRVDTPYTYMWTKNSFYSSLIQRLKLHNATVSALSYDFRIMDEEKIGRDFIKFFESQPGPSVVLCHSLGGLVFHHFLVSRTSPEWQKKYISRVYYINVPFGGCPEALFAILRSAHWDGPLRFPLLSFRLDTLHWMVGLYWCLPLLQQGKPLLRRNSQWWTDKDLSDILKTPYSFLYSSTVPRLEKNRFLPLHVPRFILYGSNISTPVFIDEPTKTKLVEEGDGIVPLDSLIPAQFYGMKDTYFIEVKGMAHERVSDCLGFFDFIGEHAHPLQNSSWTVRRFFENSE